MDNKLRKGVEAIPSTQYPHFAIFSKPLDMNEINYWLMNYVQVFIAMDFKNL